MVGCFFFFILSQGLVARSTVHIGHLMSFLKYAICNFLYCKNRVYILIPKLFSHSLLYTRGEKHNTKGQVLINRESQRDLMLVPLLDV